jgi:hypothetical protein
MRGPRLLVVFLAFVTNTCAEENADLPDSWAGAQELAVDQSSCGGNPYLPSHEGLMLVRDMARLRGTYVKAPFRCNQSVCAYALVDRAGARVLVQPCQMNPATVTKCDCLYDVSFTLGGVEAGTMVELHRRWDRYAATEEPEPMLVDRQRAP